MATIFVILYGSVNGWLPWIGRLMKSPLLTVGGVNLLQRAFRCLQQRLSLWSTSKHLPCTPLTHTRRFSTIRSFLKWLRISVEKGFQVNKYWTRLTKMLEKRFHQTFLGGRMLWTTFLVSFLRKLSTIVHNSKEITGRILYDDRNRTELHVWRISWPSSPLLELWVWSLSLILLLHIWLAYW